MGGIRTVQAEQCYILDLKGNCTFAESGVFNTRFSLWMQNMFSEFHFLNFQKMSLIKNYLTEEGNSAFFLVQHCNSASPIQADSVSVRMKEKK